MWVVEGSRVWEVDAPLPPLALSSSSSNALELLLLELLETLKQRLLL